MRKSEKQKWHEMNREQRKQYFMDYYLFPLSVITVIVAVVCFLGWHFFLKPDEKNILYATVVDDSLDEKNRHRLYQKSVIFWVRMVNINRYILMIPSI